MARWHEGSSTVYVGDAVGDPVQIQLGVVTVNRRTTVGCRAVVHSKQVDIGDRNTSGLPDYTLDIEGLGEMIKALQKQRSALIRATGGLQ